MEQHDIAVRLSGIKKKYRLGSIGGRTLQADLQSWWARKRGKEDPNLRIGTDARLIGQEFWALNGIDLTIRRGERLGIIGANGAGKSTMLKLLARITAPTEGDIDLWGRVSSMLEVGTGFHGEMTGRENIYMNGAILGMSRAEIDRRMEEIIDFSEVRDFIDTPVKRYSSGMFVKLAFSVAAHLNSEIMIMDEVLAVGDMAFQAKCLDRMRQAADDEGKTILYVSHNMATIRRLCERCIVMDQGKIVYDGQVENAIALYMNMGLGGSQVDIDLSERSTSAKGLSTGLTLEHLHLLDKAEPFYGPEDDLRLRVRCRTDRPVQDAVFRMVITSDSDAPIGTAYSAPITFDAPGTYETDLTFPLQGFMRGTFYAGIGFFTVTDIGGNRQLDMVTRAFRFQVNRNAVWNPNIRGFLQFSDISADATARVE